MLKKIGYKYFIKICERKAIQESFLLLIIDPKAYNLGKIKEVQSEDFEDENIKKCGHIIKNNTLKYQKAKSKVSKDIINTNEVSNT